MRFDRGLFLAAGAAALAGACAPAGTTGGAAPSVAAAFPTVTCDAGVSTTPSAAAVTAQRSLILNRAAEAVTGAQAAVTAEPNNPQHHFLLGQAQVAAGDFAAADAAFDRAAELCAGFAAEIGPERERGWATAFQQGLEAYQAGDTATAVARWQMANQVYGGRPDAHYNLGVVYAQQGRLTDAAQAYRQSLDILGRMPADTSRQEMESRSETRQNVLAGLLSIGAQLFQGNQFVPAAESFRFLTGVDPNNRDAWYNYALALYKQEQWSELVPVASRITTIDPLNENARIILFNAHKGLAEAAEKSNNRAVATENRNRALAVLQEIERLPVYVDEIRFIAPEGGQTQLTGKVVGNAARAGQQVTLQFTFFGPNGQAGTQTATVAAPAKGQSATFQVPLPAGAISSFSYTFR